MDPITHSLAGIAIKQAFFNKKNITIVLVILASILPDIDYITRFWGTDVLLRYHRGITHGILFVFILPIILAFIFKNQLGFLKSYLIAVVCYGIHIIFDLSNQYGTRALSPLDWNQYGLDINFIIEPWVSIPLLISLIAGLINKKRASIIAISTLTLIVIIFGSRYYLHGEARAFLKKNVDANIYRIYPMPNDFLVWSFLTKTSNEITIGVVDLLSKRVIKVETFTLNFSDPMIELSKKHKVIDNFLYFASYPYAQVIRENNKITVIWRDLAYAYMAGNRFSAKVIYDLNGKVLEAGFKL
ncbi:MAG: metal-dependent hydrolase [Thermodesulfovibrionales bacterium]|nr:metal-dependent hydrolase [Thermodesulfovibrionales bacterium]